MATNTFGRWIKKLRAEQDLTQEQLSELVGCATPTLRSFEIGLRRPSREMAERIAEVLKVSADQRSEFLRMARQAVEPRQASESHDVEPNNPEPELPPTVQPAYVAPPRSLIGRETEINTLSHLLRDEHQRLVTIVGPGGMGKTRLAQQVAAECGRHFRDGAAFVTLAAVADGQNMPTTIADGLGLSLHQAIDVRERLLQLLAEREQLVVLDNFEHLLVPTASTQTSAIDFIQKILQRSAGIHLLITSRERLRIQRERTFELAGLSLPKPHPGRQDGAQAVEQADAAILFIERAQQVAGHFALSEENRNAVARICTLLDGMPLAIELAASWVRVLSCDEIADEIQRSIDFLVLADRDMTPRHRSMRVVFDQSWSLLSEGERRVLGEISVFRGGCRREAAVAVANASLPILASLIDKSLLRKGQAGAATRYDMHELIRQYAEEQLRTHPSDYEAAQKRHADYYLGLVAQRAKLISTERMREVMAELNGEIDNLRLAWDWAVANRQAAILHQIGMTMWIFLEVRAFYREGEEIFRRAAQMAQKLRSDPSVDRPLSDLLWAHMTTHQAYFTHRQVRPVESRRLVEPALALLRQLDDPFTLQQALFTHGGSSWFHGDLEDAVADYRAGLVIANQLQMPYLLSFHNVFLGVLLYEVGQYEESYQHLSLGVRHARQFGDPRSLSFAMSYLNRTALALGRNEETILLVDEALDIARAAEDWFCMGLALEQMALLKQASAHYEDAYRLFEEAQTLFLQIGDIWSQSRLLALQGRLALLRNDWPGARQRFNESYRIARSGELLVHALSALAGMAELFAAQGNPQRAILLARAVLAQHAHNHATHQTVSQLNEALTQKLSAEEQAAIQSRLQSTSFDGLITELLRG
ncbi:MAG: helix-turn-helix domain-containing protein [Caldilineaceae bacterium]